MVEALEPRRASILVVDPEVQFSAALVDTLREEGHQCEVVASDALLKQVDDSPPDLVVVDVAAFERDDTNVLERLRKRSQAPAVVVVTARPSLESAIRAVNTGVAAYLVKPVDPAVVLEVVDHLWHARRASAVGATLLGPLSTPAELERGFERSVAALSELREAAARLVETSPRLRLEAHPEVESLSPREREVLEHILLGHRVPTIARDLFISPHTVRNHLKSIFQKIGVGSQVELVEWLQRRP